jgi:type I restriction enzyme S subunit
MVKYLRAANVNDGKLNLRDVQEMNFSPSEQKLFSLQPGDVLVTEGSGSLSAVGASAVWQGEVPGTVCFQNTLLRLRPRHGIIDGRFLAWWARAAYASGQFAAIAGGANIHHLGAERIRALPLALPSLENQRRIADFLEVETAKLKALSAAKQHQIRVINEDAFVSISETVLPGSVSAPRGTGLMPWLPKNGLSEPLVRLGYVASLQTGVTVDNARQIDGMAVTRPYLRVANVQAGGLDLATINRKPC